MSEHEFPEVDQLPMQEGLPDPFLRADGSRVNSVDEWHEHRACLKAMLQYYMYGQLPPKPEQVTLRLEREAEILEGAAHCSWYRMVFERHGKTADLRLCLAVPTGAGPFPLIVKNCRMLLEGKGGSVESYAGTDYERFACDEAMLPEMTERGYALCKFIRTDVAPDERDSKDRGMYPLYPEYDWGAIGVWAWTYQAVLDQFLDLPQIDSEKVIATGHSRGGKTALAAAIFDERISLAAPNSSGLGGTASMRYYEDGREPHQLIAMHIGKNDHWWAPRYFDFAGREEQLPFDAHTMKALIAPRLLHNAHARQDYHANPYGTELTHRVAQDIYGWLGCRERIALHWRDGGHAQNEIDWRALLDFADLHFFNKEPGSNYNNLSYPDAQLPVHWSMPV